MSAAILSDGVAGVVDICATICLQFALVAAYAGPRIICYEGREDGNEEPLSADDTIR